MDTSTESDQPGAADDDKNFRLAHGLVGVSDQKSKQMAEKNAENEVSLSASSDTPPDETGLEGGLTAIYLRAQGERPAQDSKLPYNCDVPMLIEEIEDSYRHVWGSYLDLARHFEKHGPPEEATRYNEKYQEIFRIESELYRLSVEEWWRHKTEVLPPLRKEMRAERQQILGY